MTYVESLDDKESDPFKLMEKGKFIKEWMRNVMEQKGREHSLKEQGLEPGVRNLSGNCMHHYMGVWGNVGSLF